MADLRAVEAEMEEKVRAEKELKALYAGQALSMLKPILKDAEAAWGMRLLLEPAPDSFKGNIFYTGWLGARIEAEHSFPFVLSRVGSAPRFFFLGEPRDKPKKAGYITVDFVRSVADTTLWKVHLQDLSRDGFLASAEGERGKDLTDPQLSKGFGEALARAKVEGKLAFLIR